MNNYPYRGDNLPPILVPKTPLHRKVRAFFWSRHTAGYQGPRSWRLGLLGRRISQEFRRVERLLFLRPESNLKAAKMLSNSKRSHYTLYGRGGLEENYDSMSDAMLRAQADMARQPWMVVKNSFPGD